MTSSSPSPVDGYDPADYPPFAVTADVVVLTVHDRDLLVLAHKRDSEPHAGQIALPGTFLRPMENATEAATRAVQAKAGLDLSPGHLEQLATYSDHDRDPRMRVVSVAHLVLLPDSGDPPTGEWVAPDVDGWAFDHARIVADAVARAAAKLEYTSLAAALAGPTYTLGELQRVYEAVWDEPIDHGNFRRKVLKADGFVEKVDGQKRATNRDGSGPKAQVYRAGLAATLHPPIARQS